DGFAGTAGEKSVGPGLDDIGLGAEGALRVGDYLRPYRFGRARLRARRHEYVKGLPAVLRLREHIAEGDIRQVIAVAIDVEAINCVGLKGIRVGLGIEDDNGSVLFSGRMDCVQVAMERWLLAQRRGKD